MAVSLSHTYMFILPGCLFDSYLHVHLIRLSIRLRVTCSFYQVVSLSHTYMFILPGSHLCVVCYLGLSAPVCGLLPRSVSPSVWVYLGLSAQVCGRSVSPSVWSVTSVCQPKGVVMLPRSVSPSVWSVT